MNSNARRAGKARMDDLKLSSEGLQPVPAAPAGALERVHEQLETIYRTEARRVFATLIRLLGDFDLAEEALHDSFRAALEQWPHEGIPANPRAWLVSTGRFKAVDTLRRRARFNLVEDLDDRPDPASEDVADQDSVEDDTPAVDLHLLPSSSVARGPGRADAARGVWPHHRGDRPRLPRCAARTRAAHRARQGQDPRRTHSL